MGVVYLATNLVNGKRYVGKSVKSLQKRKMTHEASARAGSNQYFHKALRKYGSDAFEWRVLMVEDNSEDLYVSEQICIRLMKTRGLFGYNLTDGGPGNLGYKVSEVSKQKMRESKRRFLDSPAGKERVRRHVVFMTGRVQSDEEKEKRVQSRKGYRHSLETRAKMSWSALGRLGGGMKGKHHSQEAKDKISRANKRRWQRKQKEMSDDYS